MNIVDRYFPYKEEKQESNNNTIDMEQVSSVIKVQIDNAMKTAVEELKNSVNNIKKEEVDINDNNTEGKQGTIKEGEVPPNAKSCNSDNPEG